jgi:hypothetical protein
MLINHDFDWDADLEESPRSGVDPTSGNARWPDLPRRPDGQMRPGELVVIVERHRGFSRSTLILALVALALSVASTIPKAPRKNAAATIDRPQTQPNHDSPAEARSILP